MEDPIRNSDRLRDESRSLQHHLWPDDPNSPEKRSAHSDESPARRRHPTKSAALLLSSEPESPKKENRLTIKPCRAPGDKGPVPLPSSLGGTPLRERPSRRRCAPALA